MRVRYEPASRRGELELGGAARGVTVRGGGRQGVVGAGGGHRGGDIVPEVSKTVLSVPKLVTVAPHFIFLNQYGVLLPEVSTTMEITGQELQSELAKEAAGSQHDETKAVWDNVGLTSLVLLQENLCSVATGLESC